jgi:hypothetical protein
VSRRAQIPWRTFWTLIINIIFELYITN